VYVEAPDSVSHLFGHLHRGTGLSGELERQRQRYGGAVEAMYRRADAIVGSFLEAMDEETTLIVLSDHGFQLGVLPEDPSKLRDMRRVSESFHLPYGILYMYGKGVKAGARIDGAGLLDIAPTILALAGLPPARDMPGDVLSSAGIAPPEAKVDTYETAAPANSPQPGASQADAAVLERLRSLGYLDTDSPQGDRNMAGALFQEQRYEEAALAYERLIAKTPDDGALHASLGGVYAAMGRYDDALRELRAAEKLAPLNPETYFNRGLIHERRGENEEAAAEYRRGLRYDPSYEPARRALARLTGSGVVFRPNDAKERAAMELATKAGDLARRGDYRGADRNLDEAERLAPHLALIYQHRSNVAFLRGDRAAAAAALRKALEIEPDNELFKANLMRLQEEAP
jgi:tetratricopeptide (TPR) repeat protein